MAASQPIHAMWQGGLSSKGLPARVVSMAVRFSVPWRRVASNCLVSRRASRSRLVQCLVEFRAAARPPRVFPILVEEASIEAAHGGRRFRKV